MELGLQKLVKASLACYWFSSIFYLLHSSFILLSFTIGYFPLQIFIPILHDYHWFLIAISVKDRIIHVLDSLPGESRESLICQIIKTLKEHLPQSNAGSKYKIDVVPVQKQSNTYFSALLKFSLLLLLLLPPHFYGWFFQVWLWFPRVALHRKLWEEIPNM